MAESVVVQPPQRFFCHLCNVEIDNVSSEFTCPLCAGGFIEELPPGGENNQSDDVEMTNDFDHRITDQISSLLMSTITGNRQMDDDGDHGSHGNQDGGNSSGGQGSGSSSGTGSNLRWGRRNQRRRGTHDLPNFDNIMHEFLISIGTGSPMFFMGNPGDYAWGREGLDTVITQMLNQMENSGPPPLSKEKIQDIPRVAVDDIQVKENLQCSVCWDDFQIQEMVRKLPCLHIYHENCIVPWLELHGTCPVCRKPVDKDVVDDQNTNTGLNITNSIGQVYRALNNLRGDNESLNSSSTSEGGGGGDLGSSTTSTASQPIHNNQSSTTLNTSSSTQPHHSQSSDSSSLSSRRDDDGNIEYDFD